MRLRLSTLARLVAAAAVLLVFAYLCAQTSPPAYWILSEDGKDGPDVQHRYAVVIYPKPHDRAAFEREMRDLYARLRADIYATSPDARYKRISFRVHVDERDEGSGKLPLCLITSGSGASAEIPIEPRIKYSPNLD